MTDIGQTISHFRIVSRLGSGGMGEVYLAEDSRLHRMVALKRVSESLTESDEARRRLLHEARTAAQLNHPNIAAIYDVVETGNHTHIVMEYVEGESLSARLRRGAVPVHEALRIGTEVADALDYAHARKIIHRDLKPANLMLTAENRVKVLDFGLARKSILPASAASGESTAETCLTTPGAIVGTLAYMSPEQVMGKPPEASHDIYSLGVVLYELVTGKKPFEARDPMGLAMAILQERPPTPSEVNPGVPPEVSDVICRAMAPEPEKRYPSAQSLRDDLEQILGESTGGLKALRLPPAIRSLLSRRIRRFALGVFALLLIVVAVFLAIRIRSGQRGPEGPGGAHPIIAVLPFLNLSGSAADESLCSSFAYILNSRLASAAGVTMVPHSSVLRYRDAQRDLKKIARELGATLLIDGGIQHTAGFLVIDVTLVPSAAKWVAWANRFSGGVEDVLVLQQQLAEGLIGALQLKPSAAELDRMLSLPTRNRDAFADYSQARSFLERQDVPGNVDRAIKLFQSAVGRDPQFALAHSALGQAFLVKYRATHDAALIASARESTLEALRLDPGRAEIRLALAVILDDTGKPDEALKELEKALALRPRSDEAHQVRGQIFLTQGKADEAIREYQAAVAIRPEYWANYANLGYAYFSVGRLREAVPLFRRITELQPDNAWGFQMLGTAYHALGDTRQALANYMQTLRISPNAKAYSNIGTLQYERNNFKEAARAYEQAVQLDPRNPISRRNLGDACQRLGEMDKARGSYSAALSLSVERLKVNPKDARSLALIAFCEAKLGRLPEAERHAREAAELGPKDNEVLFKKAVVHSLAGQKKQALVALRQALVQGYSARFARADYDLAGIRDMPEFEQILSAKR